MRIALKITLAITLWTVGVLVTMYQRELDAELDLVDSDLRDELLLMGRALRPLLAEAWARGGDDQVSTVLSAAYASEKEVRLRWIGPTGDAATRRHGTPDSLAGRRDEETIAWPNPENPQFLFAYVPIVLRDGSMALIELRRSLDLRRDLAQRNRRQLLITVAVIGTFSAVMAVLLGWTMVGQRVGRLVSLSRAVGRGVNTVAVPPRGNDELSELTIAMNTMAGDLARARTKAEQEAVERERLIQELRHADRLATIGALMSRIAHEIGTPLNVIAARTKRIARQQVTGDAAVEDASIAAEQTHRITEIVRSFLDFSRTARDPSANFPAAQLVEQVQRLLLPRAQERHVDLVLGDRAPATEVHGNLLLLQQALTNVVINAIDASTADTHVTIDVAERTTTPPEGRGSGPGIYVAITVGDRGSGIAPEVRDLLFEPFFTTKPAGKGTGLGLSIAAGIIHEHHGWVDVRSEPNRGTQITLFLPRAHVTKH